MRFTSKNKLLKEGAWVLTGQIGSAIGVLIGMRVLTEFAPPDVFGAATLYAGVVALALGTLITPVLQATLRYYPDCVGERVAALRSGIYAVAIKRLALLFATVLICFLLSARYLQMNGAGVLLCCLLLVLDSMRGFEVSLLNAARKQKSYAFISLAEAWGRPFMAVLAIHLLGVSVESIIMAYVLTSAVVLLVFYFTAHAEGTGRSDMHSLEDIPLKKNILHYSRPLIPMAALGWMNGLGDRYLIGGMIGVADAGIYSAVYGLMSRPFLIASSAVEITLRPIYNRLVAEKKHREAHRLLMKWLLVVGAVTVVGFALIIALRGFLIRLLLAEKYRGGLPLMAWIAGGYVFLALSDVLVKICYAYGYTWRILMVQIVGAVLSLSGAIIGIRLFGMIGAAMAVPVYYGIMLIVTMCAARVKAQMPQNDKQLDSPVLQENS